MLGKWARHRRIIDAKQLPLEETKGVEHMSEPATGPAPDPVQAQLEAYNDRDIERFIAAYAPDIVIEDGDGTVLMQGQDSLRQQYGNLFATSPNLHCTLAHRIRVGEHVIDEERVVGLAPEEVLAVAIYRVRDGKIVQARFLR